MKKKLFKILNILVWLFLIYSCTPDNSITPNNNITDNNFLKFKIGSKNYVARTVFSLPFDEDNYFKINTNSSYSNNNSINGWIEYENSPRGPQDPLWDGTISVDSALKKITFINLNPGAYSNTTFHCDSLQSSGAGDNVSGIYVKLNITRNDNSNNGIIEGNFNGKVKEYYYDSLGGGDTYLSNQLLDIQGTFKLKIKIQP
jgi:hypothetical protein